MKPELKAKLEATAEEKCKYKDPVLRELFIAGFMAGAKLYFTKAVNWKDRYEKQKVINLEMLEEADKMLKALDKANIES